MKTFWYIVVGQPALKSVDITAATIDFDYILVKLGALLGFWQNLFGDHDIIAFCCNVIENVLVSYPLSLTVISEFWRGSTESLI